jgi:hypothetical protein
MWDNSVDMQRSDSQSTNCTVNSSQTTSTSGYSSVATDYSFVDPALTADGKWQETQPYPDPSSFYEPPDANHVLSATGSQYQQSGYQLPQTLQLASPLQAFSSQAGIENAAWQATLAVNPLAINPQPFPHGGPSLITSEAVEEALQRHQQLGTEEPVRPAVQDVLYQKLYSRFSGVDHFYADITRALEEAAYQLQIRLQGPNVLEICFLAIVTVLVELAGDMGTDTTATATTAEASSHLATDLDLDGPPSPPRSNPTEKERFRCPYPSCPKGASRQADLDRHIRIVHLDDDAKTKFLCDYKKCGRHTDPFFRQDHFRDHLRTYHKEDLLRRGNKGDDEWWTTRAPRAMYNGWWRCSRCLVRVGLDECGWVCAAGCGTPCEKERQAYRIATADAGRELLRNTGKGPSARQRRQQEQAQHQHQHQHQHQRLVAVSSSSSGRRRAYAS